MAKWDTASWHIYVDLVYTRFGNIIWFLTRHLRNVISHLLCGESSARDSKDTCEKLGQLRHLMTCMFRQLVDWKPTNLELVMCNDWRFLIATFWQSHLIQTTFQEWLVRTILDLGLQKRFDLGKVSVTPAKWSLSKYSRQTKCSS